MALSEPKLAVIIADVISLLANVIHENVHVVKVNVMILDDALALLNALFIMLDELIRKALSVEGDASVRRIVQDGDVFRLVAALGMTDDGYSIVLKVQLLINALIPLQGVDLLQGIHLVRPQEIIHPLIAGSAAEGHDRLLRPFIQDHGRDAAASAIRGVKVRADYIRIQNVRLFLQRHQHVLPVKAVHAGGVHQLVVDL